ncbi:transposase [Desulfosediminicola ganghwensis]|uniref:transposase n=1 Tax=Desulfosediminicola ganghwensis TaxID=2569540 RepID=UPI003B82F923
MLKTRPLKQMRSSGRSITSWLEPIARMFRYYRSNGILEGFHRKMKLVQERT